MKVMQEESHVESNMEATAGENILLSVQDVSIHVNDKFYTECKGLTFFWIGKYIVTYKILLRSNVPKDMRDSYGFR